MVRGADGPMAIRVARSAAPAFQLTWKRGALAWGDAGVGHVFVPRDDLARLSFTNAWWWWDSV